jgi:FK506-binding nuclear protein
VFSSAFSFLLSFALIQDAGESPAAAAAPKVKEQTSGPVVKKLPNGLQMQDVLEGSGPEAKKGKYLHMNYVGRLTNNRVFDKTGNKPFSFRLGMGEVIKGWDQGIQGMKVGGKRRLTIPATLA